MLNYIDITSYVTEAGFEVKDYALSYEVAGCPLHTAPIVLVNHALTGNSTVAAPKGWWSSLIGEGQTIDTNKYTILAFNIPGNAYDGNDCEHALSFTVKDVASLFLIALDSLGINKIDTLIGASMGGALSLQMAYLQPDLARQVIFIASDFRASDWLLAQTLVQKYILANSKKPLEDARIHAMLCYRSPHSINERFAGKRKTDNSKYEIEDWLDYHGKTLAARFSLNAYRVMTNLTAEIRICDTPAQLAKINSDVHIVSIESDLLFPHERSLSLYEGLKAVKHNTTFDVIKSPHGHDAFLIEYNQLCNIVSKYCK